MNNQPSRGVRKFLAGYSPAVQEIAFVLRQMIFDTLGEPEETLALSARVIGYGFRPGYKGVVCTIIPSKSGVKLGIPYGASLPDPRGLLAGAGKVHRHIAFTNAADVKRAGAKSLLKATFAAWKTRTK